MTDNPSEEQNEDQTVNKYGVNRRDMLKRAGVATSALALSGISVQPVAAKPNTKKIKCGQRKVGYLESGETDEYQVTVTKETKVTATLEAQGPGYDKGRGYKGGQGNGKGQDTESALCLELVDSNGGDPEKSTSGVGSCVSSYPDPGPQTISVNLCLTPGTHPITVKSGQFKYQLSIECEEC